MATPALFDFTRVPCEELAFQRSHRQAVYLQNGIQASTRIFHGDQKYAHRKHAWTAIFLRVSARRFWIDRGRALGSALPPRRRVHGPAPRRDRTGPDPPVRSKK
jgi:hypothetical protein